jgi:hypothetical protein
VAKSLDLLITKSYAVVEVAQPNHRVMVFDRSVALELESMADSFVVAIAFLVVCEASSQMSRHKTYRGITIFNANGNSSFVSCHSRHAGLHFR